MDNPCTIYHIGQNVDRRVKTCLVRLKIYCPAFEKPKMEEWRYYVLSPKELTDILGGKLELDFYSYAYKINWGVATSFYFDVEVKEDMPSLPRRYRSFYVADQKILTELKKKFKKDQWRPKTKQDVQRDFAKRYKALQKRLSQY